MDQAVLEIPETSGGEVPISVPKVYINGDLTDYLYCVSAESTAGIVPGSARFRVMFEHFDQTTTTSRETNSPNTLNTYGDFLANNGIGHGSRVVVTVDDTPIYAGNLLKRQDSAAADEIFWTAMDDRTLLASIPIRGAVVRDAVKTGSVYVASLLPRYYAHFNPGGRWNCIGHKFESSVDADHPLNGQIIPIFSHTATLGRNYESPDLTFSTQLVEGTQTAWTPRRVLQYLYFLSTLGVDGESRDIPGLITEHWRSLKYSTRISINGNLIGTMSGIEASENDPNSTNSSIDPLDRKLPDMNLQGQMLLGAMESVLSVAGTHGMHVEFESQYLQRQPDGQEPSVPPIAGEEIINVFSGAKSILTFHPRSLTAEQDGNNPNTVIQVMQQGNPSALPNALTAYDFQLLEDSTYAKGAVLVEGEAVRTETRLGTGALDLISLVPAWTIQEEITFLEGINGGTDDDHPGAFATFPDQQLDPGFALIDVNMIPANGQSGRPEVFPRTAAAVGMLRQIFPKVFRAYYINHDSLQTQAALNGHDNQFVDNDKYPQLKAKRRALTKQLQYLLSDTSDGDVEANWIKSQYPVRVQVSDDGADKWVEAGLVQLTITADGLIWLDNAESQDGMSTCLYDGFLIANGSKCGPNAAAERDVRLNLAMPMDHRTSGYATLADGQSLFRADFDADLGGPAMSYIDSPNAYFENHQVASYPTSNTKYIAGSSTLTAPITRYLPPGTESDNAQYAAGRKLFKDKLFRRISTWKYLGIRPYYSAGKWVSYAEQIGATAALGVYDLGYARYYINAPIENVTYDFMEQTTNIGGLITES